MNLIHDLIEYKLYFFDISKICNSLPNNFSFKISMLQNATLKDKKMNPNIL